jgi:hypothetical protein
VTDRDTSIIAQALAKSVIEAVPPERWGAAAEPAFNLYASLVRLAESTRQPPRDAASFGAAAPGGGGGSNQPAPPTNGETFYEVKTSKDWGDAVSLLLVGGNLNGETWVSFNRDAAAARGCNRGDRIACELTPGKKPGKFFGSRIRHQPGVQATNAAVGPPGDIPF